ncbi:hypothetical protein BW723_13790 [Polaribacter reichenbachii]|uniref:Uncharacterized protein n=1 Tax=Polaribacter reichenbachii TaxID=996801 RepID=A0A1B8U1J7_9FLAO|nr:hypothetical protein [Polaribacter reichenbachii]APZ47288.1 hypothetical protein BW723_13790 [Polaribacter reichenbachii]AUC17929.1 hypothetical protein BTO17_04245 [Polaribacter reichenbachii]OBY65746.1 hypothetical protein LPB301_07990 [Polaribacter reichenbachii]
MELANIEKLVEKYENAETTLQEEAILKNYFTKEEVAPHLQEYSYMFNYFTTVKDETYTKTIKLEPKKSNKINFKWLSVAASVMLLFSVFVGKIQYDEYQDRKKAEEIYAQVNKGLQLLSTNLKKGEQAVAQLYKQEDKANKALK